MKLEQYILTENIDMVLDKIRKLNKRAVKLNVQPIVVTVTNETTIEECNKKKYHMTKIVVEGETPSYNGWSLTAVKSKDQETGLIINTVPEKVMPEEFRTTGTPCEHCKSNRVRNNTYILEKNIIELTDDEKRYI